MPTWKHCITARLLVLKDPADMLAWLTPVIADAASADFGFVDASTYAAAGECCSRYPATGAAAATELQQHGVACTAAAAASQHQGMQVARSLQPQHDSATKPNHKCDAQPTALLVVRNSSNRRDLQESDHQEC